MKPPVFEMERWQSLHEHEVPFNLAESGVAPLPLGDLLEEADVKALLQEPLAYAETQGAHDLREAIAALYPGSTAENVLVTTGTSEANFLAAVGTLSAEGEAVMVLPNYLQVWGLATTLASRVRELPLRKADGWQPSMEEAQERISAATEVIALSHPNNPTGTRLSEEVRRGLVDLAEGADAWILADEVYRGAEREGERTPSFWGTTEKVLITSGLSKAFGLPGLRLGWICGPTDTVARLWALHDYTTIAITTITTVLGVRAVRDWRPRLWARARRILQENFPALEAFVKRNDLPWVPPEAGAIGFVGYPEATASMEIAERAREAGVLLVPGSHFAHEGYLRIGFGMELATLQEGLRRLEEVLRGAPG